MLQSDGYPALCYIINENFSLKVITHLFDTRYEV